MKDELMFDDFRHIENTIEGGELLSPSERRKKGNKIDYDKLTISVLKSNKFIRSPDRC